MWKRFFLPRKTTPQIFGTATVGQRSEQQDVYSLTKLSDEGAWLLLLADGMGGHEGGEVASRIAVDNFAETFLSNVKVQTQVDKCFELSLDAANNSIASYQSSHPQFEGMGTTIIAAYISDGGLRWVSVGDSPMWLLRRGQMLRLNEDHSLRDIVGEFGKNANMLRSALTGVDIPLVDSQLTPVSLRPDDILIISSDGLLTLDEVEICKIAKRPNSSAPAIAEALIEKVVNAKKPNQDNCTLIIGAHLSNRGVFSEKIQIVRGFSRMRIWLLAFVGLLLVGLAVAAWLWLPHASVN